MTTVAPLFIDEVGMSALGQIVGNKIVVSIGRGRVKGDAVYFDKALIEYWPPDRRRRFRSNLAVPVTGAVEDVGDYSWIKFAISRPIKVYGRKVTLPNGHVWWNVPSTFDYWPTSRSVVSRVDVFEEKIRLKKKCSVATDARIEIRFKDRRVLSMEVGALGVGFVFLSNSSRRPWRSRKSLRLRQRLN